MKIKRFFAKDMRTALNEVKAELGADAVIMSNKKLADGVEIVAAIDHDTSPAKAQSKAAKPAKPAHNERFIRPAPAQAQPEKQAAVADSLAALLERQTPNHANTAAEPKNSVLADMFNQSGIEFSSQQNAKNTPVRAAAKPAPVQTTPVQSAPAITNDDLDGDSMDNFAPNAVSSHASQDEISVLRNEMNAIRQLLEHQVSGLMQQDMARRDPTRAYVIDRLQDMGIHKDVAQQMACFIPDDGASQDAWQTMLDILQSQLHTTNNAILRQGGVYALVGPTGVGKTTTTAKLAALGAQKYGADQVALITTDTYRIGAYEQLATYGRIIGCQVKQVKDANELASALGQLRNKKLVLIDTAGMSQRDLRLTEQLNNLMTSTGVDIRSYLVLSATAQYNVLQDTVKHFKKIALSGCIFTKLDESLSLGEIISIAIQHHLPVGYLTNGQQVPEDIRVANAEKMIKKAEQLFLKRTNSHYSPAQPVASQPVGMYD